MTNPVWPASLPQFVDRPHTEGMPDALLRTPMDAGPAKTRRRFTAGIKPVKAQMDLTAAQAATFETFFDVTLKAGALAFDWVLPRTQAAATFRFVQTPVLNHLSGPNWRLSLDLEVMP